MRRKLLTLGALATVFAMNAQTTYVGSDAKFFVSTDASVYSGGNFMIDSNREKSVENKGNITIEGNYVKGPNNTSNEGKEFVNVYTGTKDYGQVKILSATVDATARMTVQRPAPSTNYFDGSYEMSFPYVDTVKYLMYSFGKNESDFKGYCPKNAPCPDRYKMTLTKWNNNKLHHDAVEKVDTFMAGDIYNLNLRENDMKQVATGTISYKGMPSGKPYVREGIKGVITPFTSNPSQFSEAKYNDWKVMRNPYLEKYESYLGYTKTASKIYGKNIYRFGNPYTSNIDLSELDKDTQANNNGESWLKIAFNGQINSGDFRPLIKYTDPADNISSYGLKDFTILKRMDDYDDNWTRKKGTITVRSSYHAARINDAGAWEGEAEALIIRPTETFQLYFPAISLANTFGNDRILAVNVKFEDRHKTFSHSPVTTVTTKTNADLDIPGLKTNSVSGLRTASLGKIRKEVPNFHQLKISLVQDNQQLGNPVFLVGADYKKEEGQASGNSNAVFLYGVKDNEIEYKSKKEFNGFNSLSYVGKPLGVGFNHLTKGQTYRLLFGLYEGNIFNQVDKTSEFFLKDTKTNEVTQIDPKKEYTFVADEDVEKRFVIYWKALPQAKKDDKEKNPEVLPNLNTLASSHKTIIYEDAGKGRIRFENISKTADIQIYNVAGKLVSSISNVTTETDYAVNVSSVGMYMVKVTYQNGEVRILKFINK